jgi:hypothetical protein
MLLSQKNKPKPVCDPVCNFCGKKFHIKIKQKHVDKHTYYKYFRCSHCNHEYYIGIFSSEIDDLIKQHRPIDEVKRAQTKLRERYGI